jgi:adenylate cyclase
MKKTFAQYTKASPLLLSIVAVVFLVVLYGLFPPRFLEVMELKALDLRFIARGPVEPGPEVVIAVIDEKSLDEIGRWPWPRSKIADMVRKISDDGAKAIVFDIGFSEPDHNTNLELLKRLDDETTRLHLENPELDSFIDSELLRADNDAILAQTIAQAKTPVVLGYFFHMVKDKTVEHLDTADVQAKLDNLVNSHYSFVRLSSPQVRLDQAGFTQAYMPESNITALATAAQASGFFNMFPDPDGTVRWVPMAIQCQDKYFMPLSLQGLRFYLDGATSSLTVTEVGVEKVAVGPYTLPTDEHGTLLVNFRGPAKTFPHYPIADILSGKLDQGTFKDKIVLVGATAIGIYDLRVTPFDHLFPGIEIHANVIDNIISQDFLVHPNWTAILDGFAIVVIGLLLGFVLQRLSAIWGLIVALFLMAAWVVTNYVMFTRGIWINLVYPVLTAVVVYTGITVFRYMTEEREKKKIKGAFSYYVNPSVVSEMLKNPDMLKLGGEKRIMTVLFSDIRGFTTISEGLDPEVLVHILNQYLTAMTDIVFKYNGLLDKYIGDAIMAVWGAPLSQPDHARLACVTALEMMAELAELRERWKREGGNVPYLDIGIGLNTGPMVVGNMGSESRFDYTVMGDAVNLGSRLEGANKQYGTNIILGEMTYEQIKNLFYCRELDSVAVKGKAKPAKIYELLGRDGQVPHQSLQMARAFNRGLSAYKKRQWDKARRIFSAILAEYPDDTPSRLYIERVAELEINPPPDDWNGVFVMKTK